MELIENLLVITGILTLCYLVPYFIRLGWNNAENRTKKVCDLCMRDISKFNDYVKKHNLLDKL